MSVSRRKAIQRFNDWENKRYELLEKSGRRFGASVVNDRVRFGNQKEGGPVSQVAFIAMSVDNPTKNNTQFGGYAAVWLDRNRGNIYGSHNGPCTGALVFPLLALIEVLKNCPRDQPLIIACNNSMITNYVVGKTPAVSNKNHHLERYLDQINHYLGIRTAPTNSYLFCSNTRAEYVKKFYDLAQDIAREARKQRSRGSEESRSSATPELNQRDESSQEITRTVADISIIMKRLKDIEASREVILKELREPVEAYSNGREEVAVIAMSADSPRPPKDKQLGGYGVVWLNNSIENQFGNYDGKSEQSLNFLIMAATDAILQCPSDRRLVIACKNQLIVNFLNDKHPSLSKKNRELGPYIEIIERTLQTRTEPIRAILLDQGKKNTLLNTFYGLAKLVASEARRLWYTENIPDERHDPTSSLRPVTDSYRPPPRQYDSYVPDQDSSPRPRSRSPPIKEEQGRGKYLKSLDRLQKERANLSTEYLKEFQTVSGPEEQTAFIAMSSDRVRGNGYQMGGYGVVWLELQVMNHFGHYDGPFTNTAVFILKGVIDALIQSNRNRPLHIGMKNRVVYEFLSGKGDMPYKDILEPYIKAIKNLIAIRTKTIKLFFIANHDTWNDKFYEMARKVASEARKIRLEDPDQLDDSPISMPTAPSSSQPQKQKRLENIITTISQEERQMTPAQEQQKQQQDEKVQTASNVNDVLDQPSESAHNTSNSRSLEGIHPARAEMIGLLKSSSAPVVSAPPIDIEEDRSACQPLSSNIIQENVSISNNSIPTVASPFSTPMQVLPPSHNNIQHNPVENNTRSNSFVSVANHQHGESSRNDPMDTTMMTLVNNKRPVSALEDHVSKEPSLDTSKRSRLKKSGVDNTETMDKILDFSEWHAATKSMLEWLGSVLKTSK